MEVYLSHDEQNDEHRPDYGIDLTWVHRFVHMMPPAKFLFSAIHGQSGTVDSRDSEHDIALDENIVIEKIVDDSDEEDQCPKVHKSTPKLEIAHSFGKIQKRFHGPNDTTQKNHLFYTFFSPLHHSQTFKPQSYT